MVISWSLEEGCTALVTGARRGIGRAIAVGLAKAGANVIGVSAHLTGEDAVVREVEVTGRRFFPIACDLADRQAVESLSALILESHPIPDVIVHDAGTIEREDAAVYPTESWDRVLEVNLTAPFLLTRDLGRHMAERGSGKIVFIASLLSFQGGIRVPAYTASKHGMAGLVKAFSNEWAGRGVNVNGLAPGYIATDNTRALRDDPERSLQILERIPAGRWGEPEDLVGPALLLCSSAADYVHGEVLVVDGGWMSR